MEVFGLLRFPIVPTLGGVLHCAVPASEIESVLRPLGHAYTPELLLQVRIMETAALNALNSRR